MAYESYAREAREPHTPYGRVRREEKNVSPQSHSPFSASFQTFCLTARAYLNTQKYGLFCSLVYAICFHETVRDIWCLYKRVRKTENGLERGFVKHWLNAVYDITDP